MSTASAKPATDALKSNDSKGHFSVLLPYIIALAAQAPLLLYYFATLWARPHYGFFPFALVMVGVFAYLRWPKGFKEPFFSRKLSNVLFAAGIVFGIAAAMFSYAWFSGASMVLLMASLFARTKDAEVPGKSLIVLCLPLLIILMPPNNLDSWVITKLQMVSAEISSLYLDLLNFKHYSPGTVLNFPGQNYGVEQACSGVQSFFTLLFCTSFLIVSMRRPWFRAIPLLISAAFWAVFMNSIRILTIPIADIVFNVSLIDGLAHDILGYTAMLIAVLMILSTDQLLEFLFGRSGNRASDEQGTGWFGRTLGSRNADDQANPDLRNFKPVSAGFKRLALVGSIIVLALGSMQFLDVVKSMSQPGKAIRAFSSNVIVDVDKEALPEMVESTFVASNSNDSADPLASSNPETRKFTWQQVKYDREDRKRGSDFGQRSDSWFYGSRTGMIAQASLDQTFPGWHELIVCYRNQGWKVNPGARVKKEVEFVNEDGEAVSWPYIECEMTDPTTGQRGLLLFSFCDATGTPFEAPLEWGSIRSFYERAKNRLFHSLRATLFRGEAYQMQVFVVGASDFRQDQKEEVRSQFLVVRKHMRSALLKYGKEGEAADSAGSEVAAEKSSDR